MTDVIGIIPARFASSRLNGKPLADIHGKPMIQHVYERVKLAKNLKRVLVATDDRRIMDTVNSFGGEAVMTGKHHKSGTERIWEVAERLSYEFIVNIQGDEPLIDPLIIDRLINEIGTHPDADIYTICSDIHNKVDLEDPNVVKVVFDKSNTALYFSRSPIPYMRDNRLCHYKHIGIYAYKKRALKRFCSLSQSKLEMAEGLEQLRFMEDGGKIMVVYAKDHGVGVDTREDLAKVRRLLGSKR